MNIIDFRSRIFSAKNIRIEERKYEVEEVVKFKFDSGDFYIKCFLDNGYVLADDESNNFFLLVKEVKTDFK